MKDAFRKEFGSYPWISMVTRIKAVEAKVARDIRAADTGDYFESQDVEGQLQEVGASLSALGATSLVLGVKFESLPASTAGTRMAGASGLTFRVNAGSMNLAAYPDTDIRNYQPYSRIRTAKIDDSGVVQAYIDEPGFAAASGHIMTWIPKFYSRSVSATEFYIRPNQASGYSIEPLFYDYANSVELDGIWVGTLKGTNTTSGGTTKLDSLIGQNYMVSTAMPTLRTRAQANGTGFGLSDIAVREALRKLYLIAVADTDSQSAVGGGVTSESAAVLVSEANLLSMGNESGYIGADTDVPVSFFGIWDLWGNVWEWADGIFKVDVAADVTVTSADDTDVVTVNGTALTKGAAADWTDASSLAAAIDALSGVSASADGDVVTVEADSGKALTLSVTENVGTFTVTRTAAFFYTYDPTYYDDIIATIPADLSNYTQHPETNEITSADYITSFAGSPAVPKTGGATDATGYCDRWYVADGYRGLRVGGYWYNGSSAGFFLWLASFDPSHVYSYLGARLLYRP